MELLEIGNIQVEVIKKDIENIHLAVYPPDGRVRLAAPAQVNDETLRLFTVSKLPWIRRQQRKFLAQDRQSPRQHIARESHYFLGRRYLLRVVESNQPPRVFIANKTHLELHVRPGTSATQRATILQEWCRAELKRLIPDLVAKWEPRIGVQLNDWGVKIMRTKWGTCNIAAKRIWLNLELVKKPVHCIEYIVVHEMVHLLERHHNERFQGYMDQFLPGWKVVREELNRLPVGGDYQ